MHGNLGGRIDPKRTLSPRISTMVTTMLSPIMMLRRVDEIVRASIGLLPKRRGRQKRRRPQPRQAVFFSVAGGGPIQLQRQLTVADHLTALPRFEMNHDRRFQVSTSASGRSCRRSPAHVHLAADLTRARSTHCGRRGTDSRARIAGGLPPQCDLGARGTLQPTECVVLGVGQQYPLTAIFQSHQPGGKGQHILASISIQLNRVVLIRMFHLPSMVVPGARGAHSHLTAWQWDHRTLVADEVKNPSCAVVIGKSCFSGR